MFDLRFEQNQFAESDPHLIALWIQGILEGAGIEQVYFADTTVDPPKGATHQTAPRLIFGYDGHHDNLFACQGETVEVALERGSALFLPPHSWNVPTSRRALKMYSFVAKIDCTRFVNTTWDGDPSHRADVRFYHTPGRFGSVFHHLLHALLSLGRDPDPGQTGCLALNALLQQIRKELLRLSIRSDSVSYRHIRSIISYLEENYAKTINLQSAADHFNLHPNHISRLFQQNGGETFTQRLTQLRIDAAKSLLSNYSVTVDEAAQRCGFRDAGYFRKVFSRHIGQSPSQFRTAARRAKIPQPSDSQAVED